MSEARLSYVKYIGPWQEISKQIKLVNVECNKHFGHSNRLFLLTVDLKTSSQDYIINKYFSLTFSHLSCKKHV